MPISAFSFHDDFSAYGQVSIPNEYSPWGEYHCRTDQGRLGPWREATTHHSWQTSGGGCWRFVREETGEAALEQHFWAEESYPLVLAGDESWGACTVSVRMRLLSFAAAAGLVVGYRHSRDFLALMVHADRLALVHRRHADDRVLCSVRTEFTPDAYRTVGLQCSRDGITVLLEGQEVASTGWEFPGGPAGLVANAPVRFADFRIVGERQPAARAVPASRRQYPTAKLWRRIDTRGFGSDRNLRIGDIDGDGRNEIVIAQPRRYIDKDNHTLIAALTAIDLEGRALWQRGTPVAKHPETTSDLCFQLHDLDGTGKAQLVYACDLRLRVADGATGETLRSVPLPESTPGKATLGGYPMARVTGDCLHFADLRGTGRKDTIVLKNRYSKAWAYDADLNLLWEHACTTGHYPASADIDGDGREELMLGYALLDGTGKPRWQLDTFDHADGIVIGRLGPGDAPIRIALTGSDAGFFLLDTDGNILRHHKIGHAQTVVAAKLRHDVPGLQLAVNTYWGEPGLTVFMDHSGQVIGECEPVHYASLLQPANWTYDETELLLLSSHPAEGGLLDGHGNRVVRFPDDGHPFLCCDVKDIDGDGIDEILTWDEDSIWIYKPDPAPDKTPGQHPIRNALFNDSNYSGQFSFPRQ